MCRRRSPRTSPRLIANARYIEYEGSGHAIGMTDRERVNADLLAFLREAGR